MLNVSGVGVAKFEKYGQRFLDAIREYQLEHPGVVISMRVKEEQQESCYRHKIVKTKSNAYMEWTEQEEKEMLNELEQGLSISEVARKHCRTGGAIRARLKKIGNYERNTRKTDRIRKSNVQNKP